MFYREASCVEQKSVETTFEPAIAIGSNINNVKTIWRRYLQYLREWSETHSEDMFYGMSPACFAEWLDWEYQE